MEKLLRGLKKNNPTKKKTIGKICKTIGGAILALSLAVSNLAGLYPTISVYADAEKTITGLGTGAIDNPTSGDTQGLTGWTGNYVYYGTYKSSSVKYRILSKCTSDFGGTTMLLDCDNTLIRIPFDASDKYWGPSNKKNG